MIDWKKEQKEFHKEFGTLDSWVGWKKRAELECDEADALRAEINDLKQQLAEAHKIRASWVEYSQKIESGEFVLVPREPNFAMTESGLMTLKKSESGYYIGSVEHIFKAMIEAVEKDHE